MVKKTIRVHFQCNFMLCRFGFRQSASRCPMGHSLKLFTGQFDLNRRLFEFADIIIKQ